VKAGGKLSLEVRKLKVSAIYTNLPDRVVVDVTTLGLGKRIQVSDLKFDNYEIANVKDLVVAQVKATRASKQQEEA
jgi:large subunit ribosomal protein L25